MEPTYNWRLDSISAKKQFTDKNGVLRENVIKSVVLVFQGTYADKKIEKRTIVNFSLLDLESFTDVSELNRGQVLNWGLEKMHPKEKQHIENYVKSQFGPVGESNIIELTLED